MAQPVPFNGGVLAGLRVPGVTSSTVIADASLLLNRVGLLQIGTAGGVTTFTAMADNNPDDLVALSKDRHKDPESTLRRSWARALLALHDLHRLAPAAAAGAVHVPAPPAVPVGPGALVPYIPAVAPAPTPQPTLLDKIHNYYNQFFDTLPRVALLLTIGVLTIVFSRPDLVVRLLLAPLRVVPLVVTRLIDKASSQILIEIDDLTGGFFTLVPQNFDEATPNHPRPPPGFQDSGGYGLAFLAAVVSWFALPSAAATAQPGGPR
jgi:hypothetical protein